MKPKYCNKLSTT